MRLDAPECAFLCPEALEVVYLSRLVCQHMYDQCACTHRHSGQSKPARSTTDKRRFHIKRVCSDCDAALVSLLDVLHPRRRLSSC